MSQDWWLHCGKCGDSEYHDKSDAYRHGGLVGYAKYKGWKYTRARGWVCPDCVKPARADQK